MAIAEPIKGQPLQPEYSEIDDTTCPPYDNSSSQQSPLLGNPVDFDIEAQQPPRYYPGLGDGRDNAAASTEGMRFQESTVGTWPRSAAEMLRPNQRCPGPVLVVIEQFFYLCLYLIFGAFGLLAAFTVLLAIGIVLSKFAMAAIWILEKVGLI
ncbi:hypothetical protein DL764_009831 [Monosporascus ibericus]|uniref:Uncharacterized protein n=1 Tax=Monosporascus ibericus TaxID=155417 RepID=A0A4Q4STY9_9PEZI|nr:hypothetical protein DL764_009831 [Monosporascus ibericus]